MTTPTTLPDPPSPANDGGGHIDLHLLADGRSAAAQERSGPGCVTGSTTRRLRRRFRSPPPTRVLERTRSRVTNSGAQCSSTASQGRTTTPYCSPTRAQPRATWQGLRRSCCSAAGAGDRDRPRGPVEPTRRASRSRRRGRCAPGTEERHARRVAAVQRGHAGCRIARDGSRRRLGRSSVRVSVPQSADCGDSESPVTGLEPPAGLVATSGAETA